MNPPVRLRPFRLGAMVVALVLVAVAAAAQMVVVAPAGMAPGISTLPTTTGDALIMGRIVDATSRRPVSGAIVALGGFPPANLPPAGIAMLLNMSQSGQPVALTNADGQFVFRDLGAGRYSISVQAAGYLPGAHGSGRPEGTPASIRLGAAESKTDVEISVWKAASIAGEVIDEAGEPVVEVSLRVLRRTMLRGRTTLAMVGAAQSDDRGRYRVGNLVPGEYVVLVPSTLTTMPASVADEYLAAMESNDPASRQRAAQLAGPTASAAGGVTIANQRVQTDYGRALTPPPAPGERFAVYPMAFHPAASSPQEATVVAVGSGEERTGVDVRTRLVPSFSITGVVAGAEGPMPNTTVRLVPSFVSSLASDGGLSSVTTSTDAVGRFTLIGVTPGDYHVRVVRLPAGLGAMSVMRAGDGTMTLMDLGAASGAADTRALSGEVSVAVRDRDLAGVSVMVTPGAAVSGRAEFVGTAKPPAPNDMPRGTVGITRIDGQLVPASQPTRFDAGGTFTSGQFPTGHYVLSASSPVPGWHLRSVRVGGREMVERAIDLTSDVSGVVLTFTDTLHELAGSVRAGGGPLHETTGSVALFPANHREWIATGMGQRLARRVEVARDGSFEIHSLLPGDYLVAAVTADSRFDLQDPADIEALARIATPVSLVDTQRGSVSLTITRLR